HGGADLAFEEGLSEQGEEVAGEEGLDAGGGFEEDGRDELDSLELVVSSLEVGLVLVGGQQLRVGEGGVVADHGGAAVAGGVGGDGVVVDGVGKGEPGPSGASVAGGRSGPAGVVLPVGLVNCLSDLDSDEAVGVVGVEDGGGGPFDGYLVTVAGLGAGELA